MTVEIVYFKNEPIIDGNTLTPEQKSMLEACLKKIKESDSISNLACQSEVYKDCYLHSSESVDDNQRLRLCTVRINDQARLFYTTYQNKFIPLDACWDHKLDDFYLVKNQVLRNKLAMEIIQTISAAKLQENASNNIESSPKNLTNLLTENSKKILSKKSIITLTDDQESIIFRANESQAKLCFGPPGTGKTEVAKAVIERQFEGLETRYFTLGARLCSQVHKELSDSANHLRCETWDELHASLIEVFEEIKTSLIERCRLEQESKTRDSGATKKSKGNPLLVNAVKTEHEKLLEELESILANSNLEAANLTHFNNWYKSNKQIKYSQDRNIALSNFDEHLLFAEFTRIIIQQGNDLSRAYLKIEAYLSLGGGQSYIHKTPDSLRRFAYECFEKYIASLEKNGVYEPHIHMHHIFQFIQKIKRSNLSPNLVQVAASKENDDDDDDDTNHDFFSSLKTDILVLDEAQQMPIWLLHILMALQPRSLYLFADPHQIMGPQATRVIEPLRNMLSTYSMTQKTYALNKNFRNAKSIGAIANTILNFERHIYGSSEREAEFLLDCEHIERQGMIDCKPDNEQSPRDEMGNHQAVIIVPDQFKLTDIFRARWGNNIIHISEIGGLEWNSVTMVGFSQFYKKELRELSNLQGSHPLQVPMENTTFARKKEAQETLPSLASRDVLHRLYTIATRAKHEFHLVDEHPFLKELIRVVYPSEMAAAAVSQEPTVQKSTSTPLEWIALARQYFEEGTSYETAMNILWGNEIWRGLLRPEIQKFLSSLESKISICNVIQSLFEMPETERMNWLRKIHSHSNPEMNNHIIASIMQKTPLDRFNEYETNKEQAALALALKEKKTATGQSEPDKNAPPAASNIHEPKPNATAQIALSFLRDLSLRERINKSLYQAAKEGNLATVINMIKGGADVNQSSDNGDTPLLIAVKKGRKNVVDFLLAQEGIKVNQFDLQRRTPLFFSALCRDVFFVKILLARNDVDVNLADSTGITPFYVAAQNENPAFVQAFLERKDIDYTKCAHDGSTPFFTAVDRGHVEVVQKLIHLDNIDISSSIQNRTTVLHLAADAGNLPMVQILVEKLKAQGLSLDQTLTLGETALFLAAHRGHVKVVHFLLSNGADINASNEAQETPLYIAAFQCCVEVVQRLLEQPNVNINQSDKENRTPLYIAAYKGCLSIVNLLLDNGADPNLVKSVDERSPLIHAALHGHLEIVISLLDKGANINKADRQGTTPLIAATIRHHTKVVEVLMQRGADTTMLPSQAMLTAERPFGQNGLG